MSPVAAVTLPLALALLAATPSARPTRAAIQRTVESAEKTLVLVKGPKRSGTGVIVSAQGHVVTAVEYVKLEQARIVRGQDEQRVPVTFASARLGVAMVKLESVEEHSAAAVRLEPPRKGEWLIALERGKKGVLRPSLARVLRAKGPHRVLDTVLRPGTPLYDEKGRLVALAVTRGRALPMSALKGPAARAEVSAP